MTKIEVPPSEIQYVGLPGATDTCENAVMRLIQFGDKITFARILTHSTKHALLLTVNGYEIVAVRSGFEAGYPGSGYNGSGSQALARVIRLLADYGAKIEEYEVSGRLLHRVNSSALSKRDLLLLETAMPVRPVRYYRYLRHYDGALKEHSPAVWRGLPAAIPYSVLDPRLLDLAMGFLKDPDATLLTGYRRLEDIVRARTGLTESGNKLFSAAFNGDEARLVWAHLDPGERKGRASLFTGAYSAYRNPRAHRELGGTDQSYLTELLLLNQLYLLEGQATESQHLPK